MSARAQSPAGDQLLQDVSDRALLGYQLMLAFEGFSPPAEIMEWVASRSVGGFTLFRALNVHTPAQVCEMNQKLQTCAAEAGQPPLLIAADQEGGQFIGLGDETTAFPGNMALGAARDPGLAREVGYAIGRELAAMGVNVNYAPVCDVNTNPANPSLGIRSFGDDPTLVASMAAAMVEGLQAAGVAATIKHFPGKGDADLDSHVQMPLIAHGRERLEAVEFRPFKEAIAAGARMVMTGHFAIPAITGTPEVPATLSSSVVTGLLREDWGFGGVAITDALDMGAITQGAGQIIDVIAAVRAGVDLLLLAKDRAVQERIAAGLDLAYTRGLIDGSLIRAATERILALKEWLAGQPQPDLDVVGCEAHQQLARRVSEQALTLVRDDDHLIPLKLGADARIAVIMPRPKDLTPADTSSYVKPSLADALRSYPPAVDEFITSHPPTASDIAGLREKAAGYDLLVIGTISASMQSEQAALVSELLALGIPTVTVALRTPYDLMVYPQARTHVCAYSIQPPIMIALARALWGEIPFQGRLPAAIPGVYSFGHRVELSAGGD